MNLAQSVRYFYQKCNIKKLKLKTIKNYEFHLNPFIKYMTQYGDIDIRNINEAHILDYLSTMPTNYSHTTIRHRYIYLKIFFNKLCEANLLVLNPMKAIDLPKKHRTIIYSFNREEIHQILTMFDKTDFIGFRNYTIIATLFGTGVRKSELTRITVFDVTMDSDVIKIYGKGDKERFVPISPSLRKILSAYVKRRKKYIEEHGYYYGCDKLFIGRNGRELGIRGIDMLFNQIKNSNTKWSTRVSAHTWRHTFAKLFLLNGGDIFTLQKILGHNDIESTRIYVDLNTTEIRMQNDKFNPLDNTRWQYY